MLTMRPLAARSALEKRVRHVEQAIEVHRHDVLPILDHRVRFSGKGVAPVDAGIVDQDRDRTDIARDLCRDVAASHPIRDVERKVLRLAAGATDIRRRLGRRLAVDVEHRDLRALARIAKRNRAADPGAGAGNDRDVVLQKPGHWRPPLC